MSDKPASGRAEVRIAYTAITFGDQSELQEEYTGDRDDFAADPFAASAVEEDPFAATAVKPSGLSPKPVSPAASRPSSASAAASASSQPPRAAPQRPSAYVVPPPYQPDAGRKPSGHEEEKSELKRSRVAKVAKALNSFGKEDSAEGSSSDDEPPPLPVVKITALKEQKATKVVKSPRKFGTKKARKTSGGGSQSLMGDDVNESEI